MYKATFVSTQLHPEIVHTQPNYNNLIARASNGSLNRPQGYIACTGRAAYLLELLTKQVNVD